MKKFSIIIIGAGHAGCEAALASARIGCDTLLITMRLDKIGHMPCNPSIGGVGKGQLVKEIDAMGGEMGKAADAAGIHFRMLNRSRGPAVWSSRAQVDRHRYSDYMREKVLSQENLKVVEDKAIEIIARSQQAIGIRTEKGREFGAKAVVVTPGTFLNGLIHIGLEHRPGGRYDEPASDKLSESLGRLGFDMATLKTGTTPRLKKSSIDFEKLEPQPGDKKPLPFSFSGAYKPENKILCHIAYTNPATHAIIERNLNRSPLYTGIIQSTGVRYCPSIEDKVIRFSGRPRHQVFLEPEGTETDWYYPNGISTSLPVDIQQEMVNSIAGLERAEIIRPGYGIEYSFVQPTQLLHTLETKHIKGLYLAGQINGTTGYEEAAAQGLIAGINAALKARRREAIALRRFDGYTGVLIDDLITKGTNEPYRMFTSRVEYRLMLREDNADLRLRRYGYRAGLVSRRELKMAQDKSFRINGAIKQLHKIMVKPGPRINRLLKDYDTSALNKPVRASELLRRPQIKYENLKALDIVSGYLSDCDASSVELLVKYEGFIKRQLADIEKMKKAERVKVPQNLDFTRICGLSGEIVEKLDKIRPVSLGQASRISGVTPAAIMILMVYLEKTRRAKTAHTSGSR